METGRDHSTFWNFSDQLRLHTTAISSLSLSDSIWSDPHRRFEDRRNTDAGVPSDTTWKLPFTTTNNNNNKLNRYNNNNSNSNLKSTKDVYSGEVKSFFSKGVLSNNGGGFVRKNNESIVKGGKGKKNGSKEINGNSNGNGSLVDKRFKTLPPSEALPRTEPVGGYIFVCNNETMEENLKRQLFGLPPRYRDSVRAITPGLPIFLYNYSTHQLHGIFEAASFGGANIDPAAWEDKKHPGESRFPAQIKVVTRKNCVPLEEDSFRPILHHYDGPKFRLELSVPEALALLDVFAE